MSRTQLAAPGEAEAVIDHLNRALAGCIVPAALAQTMYCAGTGTR